MSSKYPGGTQDKAQSAAHDCPQCPERRRLPVWRQGWIDDLDHGRRLGFIDARCFILAREQVKEELVILNVALLADVLQPGLGHVGSGDGDIAGRMLRRSTLEIP